MIDVEKLVTTQYNGIEPDPCPFCPAQDHEDFVIRNHGLSAQLFCRRCGCLGPFGKGPGGAIEAWNGAARKILDIEIKRPRIEVEND
jgi:hypothetical protein